MPVTAEADLHRCYCLAEAVGLGLSTAEELAPGFEEASALAAFLAVVPVGFLEVEVVACPEGVLVNAVRLRVLTLQI